MIRWNEEELRHFVRKKRLKAIGGEEGLPLHLAHFRPDGSPLLAKVVQISQDRLAALGYTETDRISLVQYLGSLDCRKEAALSSAARYRRPLSLDLAKTLIDAGARDKAALYTAARWQRPLTMDLAKLLVEAEAFDRSALPEVIRRQVPLSFEMVKFLIDSGLRDRNGLCRLMMYQSPPFLDLAKLLIDSKCRDKRRAIPDALTYLRPTDHVLEMVRLLIDTGHDPAKRYGDGADALVDIVLTQSFVDPRVTDLLLSKGVRTNLDGCRWVLDETRCRFNRVLEEHAQWKLDQENVQTGSPGGLDWGR